MVANSDKPRPAAGASYLTEPQFCERYHVSPRTAQRWRLTGLGPRFVRFGGKRILYRLDECESWAAARTFASTAEAKRKAAA